MFRSAVRCRMLVHQSTESELNQGESTWLVVDPGSKGSAYVHLLLVVGNLKYPGERQSERIQETRWRGFVFPLSVGWSEAVFDVAYIPLRSIGNC